MQAHVYHQILAVIDFGYGSRDTVEAAAAIARATGARLTLLHVLDYTPTAGAAFPFLTPFQERSALVMAARRKLRALAAAASYPETDVRVLIGHPQSEIPEAAAVLGADLVIVGNRRVRVLARLRARLREAFGRPGWDVMPA